MLPTRLCIHVVVLPIVVVFGRRGRLLLLKKLLAVERAGRVQLEPRSYTIQVEAVVLMAGQLYDQRILVWPPVSRAPSPSLACSNSPSRKELTQIGQVSLGFKLFLSTRSSSSKKLSGTPLSSNGGSSAFCRSISIMLTSKSFSPPSPAASSAARPRIISNALASSRKAADMFSGWGKALAFVCASGSDVSTSSSVEKKVDRSGRREGGCGLSSFSEMLCSTGHCQFVLCMMTYRRALAFVAGHVGCGRGVVDNANNSFAASMFIWLDCRRHGPMPGRDAKRPRGKCGECCRCGAASLPNHHLVKHRQAIPSKHPKHCTNTSATSGLETCTD